MTENEAIEILHENLQQGNLILALDIARKSINELQQYQAIGTVEECRNAMEKQKAKKPINDTAFGICPNCHNEFNSELVNEYDMKYCIYCGQAIDWSE